LTAAKALRWRQRAAVRVGPARRHTSCAIWARHAAAAHALRADVVARGTRCAEPGGGVCREVAGHRHGGARRARTGISDALALGAGRTAGCVAALAACAATVDLDPHRRARRRSFLPAVFRRGALSALLLA